MRALGRYAVAASIALVPVVGATALSSHWFARDDTAERIAADDAANPSVYDDAVPSAQDPDYPTERIDEIVGALETAPVFVDAYSAAQVSADERAQLGEQVAGLDVPVHVAVVSQSEHDESDGDAQVLANRLGAELGDGVVIVESDLDLAISFRGVEPEDYWDIYDLDMPSDSRLAEQVELVLDAVGSSGWIPRAEAQPETVEDPDAPVDRLTSYPISAAGVAVILAAPLGLGAGWLGYRLLSRRKEGRN